MVKFFASVCTTLMSISAFALNPQMLWETWPESRFEATDAPCLLHAGLLNSLQALESRYPRHIKLEEAGKSHQGRSIQLLSIGRGEKKILLWSQMHGDEPSATPALLDIASFLAAHADEPALRPILENFTLLMIPMLNPDGAEVYTRRNAQGIDINRDALMLASPEGRILKHVRDEYEPMMGFNLHDQDRRTAVGNSGQVANMAVLAVSGDAANTLTPGRQRTKRASAAIVEAVAAYIPGGMARYDEDWSPRAFGDNITAWGTPVVLIESGGLPPGNGFAQLTRLNFVAILTVLQGLAHDDLAGYDPQVYEDLLRNQDNSWSDIVVRDGYMLQPGMTQAYRADLAFDQLSSDREIAGCASTAPSEGSGSSQIFMVGDASLHGSGQSIDASDSLILVPFEVGASGWSARQWLDSNSLSRLAGLGVGTVHWSVDPQHYEAALKHSHDLAGKGVTRVSVVREAAQLPNVVLTGPPAAMSSPSMQNVMTALGVESANSLERLQRLWLKNPAEKPEPPHLRKGQAASFLIVSPAPEGQIDFKRTSLKAVWLDGYQ